MEPRGIRSQVWKVGHVRQAVRRNFRLPSLPLQFSSNHPGRCATFASRQLDRHLRCLFGVRQRIPLRLAGDEGYYLSAAAARAPGSISHQARRLIGIFGLARKSLPQRAAVSTAALSAAAIVLSGVPPKTKPAAEAAGSLSIVKT